MPTLLCVPIMRDDSEAALRDAVVARERGADLVEFRVDRMFHGEGDINGAAQVRSLAVRCPIPCIITCRAAEEGGEYDGDDASRIALYESLGAMDYPPRYIDVELATLARSANLRQKVLLAVMHPGQARDLTTSLILSMHDFADRPIDLAKRLAAMRAEGAARVLKVAFRARSLRDNIELFEMLSERDRPMVALGMGEFGLMSRVLAPKFGALLTFASLTDTSATAPGQPTIEELLDLYRFRSIGARTGVYGVAGWPVAHSLSPLAHNAAFADAGFDGVYLPLPVPPEWEHFKATMTALLDFVPLDFRGASVTIPHKEHLLRLAREDRAGTRRWVIEDFAQRAGAANTLAVNPDTGECLVANTDGPALADALAEGLLGARLTAGLVTPADPLRDTRIAVIGAGGAARGAALALADRGAKVVIYNRSHERAHELADAVNQSATGGGMAVAASMQLLERTCAEALVHCTPVGMTGGPDPDGTAVAAQALRACPKGDHPMVVLDTVYNPVDTPLLRAAKEAGCATVSGVEMFVRQAALQSALWTGKAPDIARMRARILTRLQTTE